MQCRCHGVSGIIINCLDFFFSFSLNCCFFDYGETGSCELKTCWRTMPTFAQVGDYLKHKYENAVQVGMVLLFMSLSALDFYFFFLSFYR